VRIIKLMADYDCFPLWEASPGQVGNIDPAQLPISPELRLKLGVWAANFDATLNRDNPAQSGFRNAEMQSEFKRAGDEIGQQLKRELGADFSIIVQIKAIARKARV
jgi:hypothetical protein